MTASWTSLPPAGFSRTGIQTSFGGGEESEEDSLLLSQSGEHSIWPAKSDQEQASGHPKSSVKPLDERNDQYTFLGALRELKEAS
jgi:hypothetical protein